MSFVEIEFDEMPPNGMPFSRRKRAARSVKMPTISRAQRSAGTAGSATWFAVLDWHPHDRTTPAWYHALHNGRSVGTTPIGNHARQNWTQTEPRPFGIRLPTTGDPHNAPPYHISTTSFPHNGRSSHAGTTGFCTTEQAQRAFRKPDSPHPHQEKEW